MRCALASLLTASVPALAADPGATEPSEATTDEVEDEVLVVTGTLLEERQDRAVVRTQVITRAQIEASGARSVADVLETVPGLQVVPGLAGPVVQARGMDPDHTLFVLDGARLVGRVNGGLDLRRLAVEDLEQIEIVYGAGSTLWGSDALGAVVHLRTRGAHRGVRADVGLRASRYASPARGGAASTTTPLVPLPELDATDLTATVQGGGAVRGRLTVEHHAGAAWDEDPTGAATTGDATRQLRVAGRVDADGPGELRVIGRGEVTTWRRSGVDATAAGAVLDRDHAGRQIVASILPSGSFSDRVRFSGGLHVVQWEDRFRYDQRGSDAQDKIEDLRDRLLQARGTLDVAGGTRHLVTSGFEAQTEHLQADRLVTGTADRQRGALFVQHRWDVQGTEQLVVTSGVRGDVDSWFGSALSPRVAALWVPDDRVRLRASGGRGFKAPDLREMFLDFANPAVGYRVDGNPDLRPELAWNASIGGDVRPLTGLTFSTEGFWTEAVDLIQPVLVQEGRFAYDNIASARLRGLESAGRLRRGLLDVDVSWTLLDTLDRDQSRPLPGRSTHQLAGGLGVRLPALDGRATARASWWSPRTFFAQGETQKTPTATFIDLRLTALESRAVQLEIGVDNLLDPGQRQPGLLLTSPRRVWLGVHGTFDPPAPPSEEDEP